jgi:predicted small integral membrane protein
MLLEKEECMWVFTKYGFVSIACASKSNGEIDESTVMVRARLRQHLDNLKARFPDTELGKAKILDSVGTDYKYRLVIPKEAWVSILSELAMEQTWSNFKNEAARFARIKKLSDGFVIALHKVWEVMYDLQSDDRG